MPQNKKKLTIIAVFHHTATKLSTSQFWLIHYYYSKTNRLQPDQFHPQCRKKKLQKLPTKLLFFVTQQFALLEVSKNGLYDTADFLQKQK